MYKTFVKCFLYVLMYLIFPKPYEEGTVTIPIL